MESTKPYYLQQLPPISSFFTSRPPPTLEIFPSWPMRFQQTSKENSQSAESADSESAKHTISQLESESPMSNNKASSEQSYEPKQQEMIASDAFRRGAVAANHQPRAQEKILMPQLDSLTEEQLVGICSLQQSSQQTEEALSQGLEQLQQSLAGTVASGSLNDGADVGNYMGYVTMALGKLSNLEGFVRQADNLRQQTLHQLRRILTIRQAAMCFLAIGEYYSRLRALSSLWASRPRENMITEESTCPTTTDLQMIHQPTVHSHFSAF